jgi:hypothetical protein
MVLATTWLGEEAMENDSFKGLVVGEGVIKKKFLSTTWLEEVVPHLTF